VDTWFRQYGHQSKRYDFAPSWSWASLKGQASLYIGPTYNPDPRYPIATIREAHCTPDGSGSAGEVESGKIKILGSLVLVKVGIGEFVQLAVLVIEGTQGKFFLDCRPEQCQTAVSASESSMY
jgi:hypothetical protein